MTPRRALALLLLFPGFAFAQALTLEQALATARERQPTLRQVKAQVAVAEARGREAFAPMLPQVSASLAYSKQTANFVPRPGSVPTGVNTASALSWATADFWSANVGASGTLWDFGQNWNRYQAVLEALGSQQQQLRAAQVATALQVRTAYFQARAQRELVDVALATQANVQAHLDQVKGHVEVGTRPEIDLAQSRADLANARLAVVNAKTAWGNARARLNQAMGRSGRADFELADGASGPVEGEDAELEALVDQALHARPEVAAVDAQVRAQDKSLAATKAAFLPTVGAQVGATLGARELTNPVPNASGGVTLSWPLYQGGLTTAQLVEGDAQREALLAQREAVVQQVWLDVEQSQRSLQAAREALEVSGEAVVAARQRLTLAEGRYTAGAGNAIELGDAQVAYTQAAAQQVQAVYGLATARAQLLASLGRE